MLMRESDDVTSDAEHYVPKYDSEVTDCIYITSRSIKQRIVSDLSGRAE